MVVGSLLCIRHKLPEGYALIGDKVYRTVTHNGITFTAQNVELTFDGLVIAAESSDEPRADYWTSNKDVYGLKLNQWGLYYNYAAIQWLNAHPETMNGFRVATESDWRKLFGNEPVNNFKSVTGWASNNGNDSENTTLYPSGHWESYWAASGTDCQIRTGDANNSLSLWRNDTAIGFNKNYPTTTMLPIRLGKDPE
jgi:hypothetical protein